MPLAELQRIREERNIVKPKKLYVIPKKSAKKINQEKIQKTLKPMINKAILEDELKEWFAFHMEHSEKKCENCGKDLSHYKEKDWRGSQHHIIEKSEINGCPSVAAELSNHGVLGKWCCHSQWHTSWENAQKMPFFKIALERFQTFKHLIHKSEYRKIPDCFIN